MNGVEIYSANESSKKLNKIITTDFPDKFNDFIPNADFGKVNRIEYLDNWIRIYLDDCKKSDADKYIKKLKEYNFDKDQTKNDGKVVLIYEAYDEASNYVKVVLLKDTNTLEIYASKA